MKIIKATAHSWGEPKAVQPTTQEKNLGQNLAQIEGILTSPIQKKYLRDDNPYYWAFCQLEGSESEIPVIFRLKTSSECLDCENSKTICQALTKHSKGKCEECRQPHCDDCPGQYPNIPLQAKVLLKGHWADSPTNPRPSFTCLEYQILSPPPEPTIKGLYQQISELLKISLAKQSEWKQRVDYLFKKWDNLKDLEKLTKLGDQYLQAYLLLKSASYANYQTNLLAVADNFTQPKEFLIKLQKEIEEIAYQVRAYQSKDKDPFKEI